MRIPINRLFLLPSVIYTNNTINLYEFSNCLGASEAHKKLEKSGNRLIKISGLIDWTPIRQILEEMYDNKSDQGGRPNCDVILMFKILICSNGMA